jgi:hypothetical protein
MTKPPKIEPSSPSVTPPPERLLCAKFATEKLAESVPQSEVAPLAYGVAAVAHLLSHSRRTIERERAAGRFPEPDLHIGKRPLWTRDTLVRWIAEGGSGHD